jgi:hypothetical protein
MRSGQYAKKYVQRRKCLKRSRVVVGHLLVQAKRPKLCTKSCCLGKVEEVYAGWIKHGFVRMTMPGKAAPHLVDMRKVVEARREWCALQDCACDKVEAAYVIVAVH